MGFDKGRTELNYNGALWSPALVGASDPTTGAFVRSNEVGFVVGGTLIASARSFGLLSATPILAPNGTAAAPSISFGSDQDTGIWSAYTNVLGFAIGGVDAARVGTNYLWIKSDTGYVMFGDASPDVILKRDAAAVLALKNADTAQEFRVYGATTGTKYLSLKHDGTDGIIRTFTGSGSLLLGVANNNYWWIDGSNGHLKAVTDNANDIGSPGANRPKSIYVSDTVFASSLVTSTTYGITIGTGNGAANSSKRIVKGLTSMADNTAVTVATVSIPNAVHAGMVQVTVAGSLGDGDSTQAVTYNIAISRITGAATKAVASAAAITAATVGATATATTTVSVTSMSGAVDATQTFNIQVKVARSAGASTNHKCTAEITLLNTNATGITIA